MVTYYQYRSFDSSNPWWTYKGHTRRLVVAFNRLLVQQLEGRHDTYYV